MSDQLNQGPPTLQRISSISNAMQTGSSAASPKVSSLSLYRTISSIGEGTFGECQRATALR